MAVNARLPVKESAPETAKGILGVMLEKGVVDAVFNSTQWFIVGGLTDVSSYATLFYAVPTFFGYIIQNASNCIS